MALGALAATQLGLTARRLLRPGAALTLRATFSAAAHFIAPGGELLVLAGDEVAAPWAVGVPVLPWSISAFAPGATLRLSADDPACLRLGAGALAGLDFPGLTIDLRSARLSSSPPLSHVALPAAIRVVLDRAALPVEAPGLAGCGAAPLVAQLAAALSGGDPAAVATAGAPLVGLGRGLTPAGDDLLAGALGVAALAGMPVQAPRMDGRTTLLGATQVAHAAAGALIEPLHAVIAALLAGAPAPQAALRRTLALGHSSGADLLAGARLALAALSARPPGR